MAKAKKLTNKQFKQILTNCGLDFDVWGYDGILNMVIRCLYNDAEKEEKEGYELTAEHDRERARKLFEELEKRGFYN